MTVSAIITTCMREPKVVERALKSVLNQSFKNIETVVVDDSPNDYENRMAVESMVMEYAGYGVTYIKHDKCMGASAARNTGIKATSGEFIGFLDDDDEWTAEKTEHQLSGFTSSRVGLVYCDHYDYNDLSGKKTVVHTYRTKGNVYDRLMEMNNFIGGTSFPMLKRSALEDIGGFDVLLQSAQDFDTWLRIAERYEINYIPEPLVVYHFHGGKQISKDYEKKIAGYERLIEKNMDYLEAHPSAYAIRLLDLTPYYASAGNIKKSMSIWCSAVRLSPRSLGQNLFYLARIGKRFAIRLCSKQPTQYDK